MVLELDYKRAVDVTSCLERKDELCRRSTPFSVTGPWPGPPIQTKTSLTQDSGASQQETHAVFTCGHDALGGAGAQPTGTLAKLETFANVDVQQVRPKTPWIDAIRFWDSHNWMVCSIAFVLVCEYQSTAFRTVLAYSHCRICATHVSADGSLQCPQMMQYAGCDFIKVRCMH